MIKLDLTDTEAKDLLLLLIKKQHPLLRSVEIRLGNQTRHLVINRSEPEMEPKRVRFEAYTCGWCKERITGVPIDVHVPQCRRDHQKAIEQLPELFRKMANGD